MCRRLIVTDAFESEKDYTVTHIPTRINSGNRVQGTRSDTKKDVGTVIAVYGNAATVSWDSMVTTTEDISTLVRIEQT